MTTAHKDKDIGIGGKRGLVPLDIGWEITSPPEFEAVVNRDVMVPMRDRVKLATDIYVPARDGKALPGPWPVVFERTAYNKTLFYTNTPLPEYYAERGYVFVVQDSRGCFASEGVFDVYTEAADDGIDALAWIYGQPWSNKKIAVTGSSYFASTAQAILVQNPPGLAAAVIRVGPSNYHEDGAWQGGAFQLAHNVNWTLKQASRGKEATANPAISDALSRMFETANAYNLMLQSPLKRGLSPFSLTPSYEKWYQDWQSHDLYDAYWKQNGYNFEEFYRHAADVPVLLVSSWFDAFIGGELNAYLGYTATPGRRTPVHAVIGGGEHDNAYWRHTHAGDVDFGESLPIDLRALMMQWFDRYLKGADTGVKTGNLFRAFRIEGGRGNRNAAGKLQAGGTWQEFAEWPPRDAKPTKYYLTVDRILAGTVPISAEITYRYDPVDPVPSVGGNLTSGAEQVPAGPYDQRGQKRLPQCGNDLPLNARPDIISFMTPPLEKDIEVTGPVSVNLWISSSAVDTDFTAKLIDQYPPTPDYPEAYAMNLQDSIVRARLRFYTQFVPHARRSYGVREELLAPGKVYEITIDLAAVSMLFRAGHRICLDISSSNFPRFDANPNTGEPFAKRVLAPQVALNTIHLGKDHPSYLVLPIR